LPPKKSQNSPPKKTKEKIYIEEADLWKSIAGTVKPIRAESKNKIRHADLPEIVEKSDEKLPQKKVQKSAADRTPSQVSQPKPQKQGPQLTGIDRRSKQKLLRGNVDIDARLDLHGFSQIEARSKLKNFLVSSRARGAEFVLVITGKGASPYTSHMLHGEENYSAPEREGVLRQSLPGWMKEAEFSQLVSGFQPSHPKHGGGGAFYLKLRRSKTRQ